MNQEHEGHTFTVTTQLLAGRYRKSDIHLEDALVSRSHVKFYVDENLNLYLCDLNSRNGTFVNDERVEGDVEIILNHGDLVRVGRSEFMVVDQNLSADKVTDSFILPKEAFARKSSRNFQSILIIDCQAVEDTTLTHLTNKLRSYNSYRVARCSWSGKSTPFGVDIHDDCQRYLEQFPVILAYLDDGWIKAVKGRYDPRGVFNSQDDLHLLLASALKSNRCLIPILSSAHDLPSITALPVTLESLVYRRPFVCGNNNSLRLHHAILDVLCRECNRSGNYRAHHREQPNSSHSRRVYESS